MNTKKLKTISRNSNEDYDIIKTVIEINKHIFNHMNTNITL